MAAASPSETPGSSQIAPSPWERRKLGLPTPAPALPAPGLSQALSQVQNRCTSATPATTTQTSTQGGTRPPDGDNLSDSDLSDDDNILHPLNCSQKRKRLDNDDDDDECHDIDDRLHRVREVARKCGLNEKMFDQLTHFSDQSPRTQRYYLFAGMLCQNALTTNFASNVHASWEVSSTLKSNISKIVCTVLLAPFAFSYRKDVDELVLLLLEDARLISHTTATQDDRVLKINLVIRKTASTTRNTMKTQLFQSLDKVWTIEALGKAFVEHVDKKLKLSVDHLATFSYMRSYIVNEKAKREDRGFWPELDRSLEELRKDRTEAQIRAEYDQEYHFDIATYGRLSSELLPHRLSDAQRARYEAARIGVRAAKLQHQSVTDGPTFSAAANTST